MTYIAIALITSLGINIFLVYDAWKRENLMTELAIILKDKLIDTKENKDV